MSDPAEDGVGRDPADATETERVPGDDGTDGDVSAGPAGGADGDSSTEGEDVEALRRRVEREYDFEEFGPAEMAEMSAEEWEVAFDHDTWITGTDLLDRVQTDLERQVANREVFAVVERIQQDGSPRLLAYSDEGYAMVYPDGSVEGFGTVLRDVKPTVALCSMDEYEVESAPANAVLPSPGEVPQGSGEFGNLMLQVVAGVQLLAGLGLLVAWAVTDVNIVAAVAGLGFLVIALALFLTVANARLSDRFRAEEYRDRLRAVGLEDGERPEFLPIGDDAEVPVDASTDATTSDDDRPTERD